MNRNVLSVATRWAIYFSMLFLVAVDFFVIARVVMQFSKFINLFCTIERRDCRL